LLFLGAGASKPFGIPTMFDFARIFDKEFGDSKIYTELSSAFDGTFDLETVMTVLEDLSKSKEDLLETISPQTARFLLKERGINVDHPVDSDSRKRTLESSELLGRIKSIIRTECNKAVDKQSTIIKVYDDFFSFLNNSNESAGKTGNPLWSTTNYGSGQDPRILPSDLKIFTTNYDQCVETYLNQKQIEYCRGIVPRFGENVFDVDSYDSLSEQNKPCKIYKLHGSVDLFEKEGKIRKLDAPRTDDRFVIKEYGKESMRFPIEFGGYRQIIESPYLDLFRRLRDAAKEKKWWTIIGFSFRDRTVCSILNDVLRLKLKRERPTILFLNPHTEPVLNRLKEWGYEALHDTICSAQVEFGSEHFAAQLHKILVERKFLTEPHVGFGLVEK
jgi:hypothetical protein